MEIEWPKKWIQTAPKSQSPKLLILDNKQLNCQTHNHLNFKKKKKKSNTQSFDLEKNKKQNDTSKK